MRKTPWLAAEPYRKQHPWGTTEYGADYGYFEIPGPCGRELRCIVSCPRPGDEHQWEHVSVSLRNRCPNWPEMNFTKGVFWSDDEAVMQLHPSRTEYVNLHPYCLHLWRPVYAEIPLPP